MYPLRCSWLSRKLMKVARWSLRPPPENRNLSSRPARWSYIHRTHFIGLRRSRKAKDLRRSAGREVSFAALNSAKFFLISKMRVVTFSTHMGKHRLSTSCQNAVPTYCGCGSTIKGAYSGNFGPELFVAKAGE